MDIENHLVTATQRHTTCLHIAATKIRPITRCNWSWWAMLTCLVGEQWKGVGDNW